MTIPAGSSAGPADSAYYGDTVAGSPIVVALAPGLDAGTQTESILATPSLSLQTATVGVDGPTP